MRSFRLMRNCPAATVLRASPLRLVSKRTMAGAAPAPVSEEEKARLIAQFPYKWPWGQTLQVTTPKKTFNVTVTQTYPAPKQHKLAYKMDGIPVDVPKHSPYFLGVSGKATHKLFNAAVAAGNLDATKESIENFAAIYETKPQLQVSLMNPRTSAEDKIALLTQTVQSAGADATTTDVIVGLFKEKKLHKVSEVKKYFAILLADHRKEKHGAIVSAEPLTEKNYDAITAKMQKLISPDEKLVITREIEPQLVGGFIIRIGGKCQDLSVASQISRMEKHLKQFFTKNKDAADKVLA